MYTYIFGVFRMMPDVGRWGVLISHSITGVPALYNNRDEAQAWCDNMSEYHPYNTYVVRRFRLDPNGIRVAPYINVNPE